MITDNIALTDHHCHTVLTVDPDRACFERYLGEGPKGTFDSALGLAVRAHCAPVLDLPPHTTPEDYLTRRAALGWREVSSRFLGGAGVTRWMVDSGFSPEVEPADAQADSWSPRTVRHHPPRANGLLPLATASPAPRADGFAEFAGLAGGTVDEVVRLEQVAEHVIAERRHSPTLFAEIENALRERARMAVGFKSVAAYRCGLDFPLVESPPAVLAPEARLTDPPMIGWLVGLGARLGAELGMPLQFHTGFGDQDLRLAHADPMLLTDFLRATADTGLTVMLLHCWPFHRNAAYLAHIHDHVRVDLGLTIPHIGARAGAVLAETLEMAPFGSLCYSSDGFGLPELHYLAALLWRRGVGRLLDGWIAEDVITVADAEALAVRFASGNVERVYPGSRS